MTTTPNLVKPGTQVNTTDGSTAQFDGEITSLQDGGYVVVWTDLATPITRRAAPSSASVTIPPATRSAAIRRMVARSISVCSRDQRWLVAR